MINSIILEIKNILDSEEYFDLVKAVAEKHNLNEDEFGYLFRVISEVMQGVFPEEVFVSTLARRSDIGEGRCAGIFEDVKKTIFVPYKTKIAQMFGTENQKQEVVQQVPVQAPTPTPEPMASTSTFRSTSLLPVQKISVQTSSQQRPVENLSKSHILDQIENPPRTVVKKYVIEHEPIIDPEHLIDDKVDTVPKLQDHYDHQ